jgi:hypothetical protein
VSKPTPAELAYRALSPSQKQRSSKLVDRLIDDAESRGLSYETVLSEMLDQLAVAKTLRDEMRLQAAADEARRLLIEPPDNRNTRKAPGSSGARKGRIIRKGHEMS